MYYSTHLSLAKKLRKCVYPIQVSDVESEVNGFFTYDRVLKIDDAEVRSIAAAHADLIASAT